MHHNREHNLRDMPKMFVHHLLSLTLIFEDLAIRFDNCLSKANPSSSATPSKEVTRSGSPATPEGTPSATAPTKGSRRTSTPITAHTLLPVTSLRVK